MLEEIRIDLEARVAFAVSRKAQAMFEEEVQAARIARKYRIVSQDGCPDNPMGLRSLCMSWAAAG